MEDLLQELEACLLSMYNTSHTFDQELNQAKQLHKNPFQYESCIRRNGKPIFPPLMTPQKRAEMQEYKRAAISKEKELQTKKQKNLVRKVQAIVDSIEDIKSPRDGNSPLDARDAKTKAIDHSSLSFLNSSTPREDTLSPMFTSTKLMDSGGRTGKPSTEIAVLESVASTTSSSDTSGLNQPSTEIAVLESVTSTTSSSDTSVLNQTVIDMSGLTVKLNGNSPEVKTPEGDSPEDKNHIPSDTSSKIEMVSESSAIIGEVEGRMEMEAGREEVQKVDEDKAIVKDSSPDRGEPGDDDMDKDLVSLKQSFSDTESFVSFVGEYTSLPTPIPSTTPDITESSQKSVDVKNLAGDSVDVEKIQSGKKYQVYLDSGDTDGKSTVKTCGTAPQSLTGKSTTETNLSSLGSVAQSCTLPMNMSGSSDSTLADVSERWATPSIVGSPSPPKQHREEGNSSNQHSQERGNPVGQESDASEMSKAIGDHGLEGKNVIEGKKDVITTPSRHVRKSSYTLDFPSPALLDAQARNDAPHAPSNSIEVAPNLYASENYLTDEPVDDAVAGSENIETVEQEVVLLSQLELLEEIHRRLEAEQRQQMQVLKEQHQKEQWLLHQEMADVHRKMSSSRQEGLSAEEMEMLVQKAGEGFVGEKEATVIDLTKAVHTDPPSSNAPSVQDSLDAFTPAETRAQIPASHTSPAIPSKSFSYHDQNMNPIESLPSTDGTIPPDGLRGGGGFYLEQSEDERISVSSNHHEKTCTPLASSVNYDKVSAVAKGFLTRRLMSTSRVQSIIKTVKDTTAVVNKLQAETPVKLGHLSPQDAALAERILNQLRAARFELDDIFHNFPPSARMAIIYQERSMANRKFHPPRPQSRPLSAATIKALERKKKAQEAERRVFGSEQPKPTKAHQVRSKSAMDTRVLKPLQGYQSPSFPTRPVSSAAYKASRYASKPAPVRTKPSNTKPSSRQVSTQAGRSKAAGSKVNSTEQSKKTQGVRRSLYQSSFKPATKMHRKTAEPKSGKKT